MKYKAVTVHVDNLHLTVGVTEAIKALQVALGNAPMKTTNDGLVLYVERWDRVCSR